MRAFRWITAAVFMLAPLWAQSTVCDLNSDGAIDVADVQLAINMASGVTPCSANVYGAGVCNIVVAQRVVNAALGGACRTGTTTNSHSVALNWNASVSPGVAGYNIYRGTVSGGPYTKVNSSVVAGLSFTDTSVAGGQTYYYVATAVDGGNNESAFSMEIPAVVPTP
jgi:hypothetical protein